MKLLQTTLIGLMLWSGSAFGDSICVSYWPWGACALWENTSTLSDGGGSTSSRGYDKIFFKNKCSRKMTTAIHYKDMNGNWKTEGWWTLEPGQSAFVATTKNAIFYVHGQSMDSEENRLRWGGSDWHGRVRSSDVEGFRKVRSNPNSYVDYTYNFDCDGISRYKTIALAWDGNGRWATRIRNRLDDAQRDAKASCGSTCQVSTSRVSPSGFGCMAIAGANSSSRLFVSTRTNKGLAESAALSDCRGSEASCQIRWSGCNN